MMILNWLGRRYGTQGWKAAPRAQGELTALVQMVGWDQRDNPRPHSASTMRARRPVDLRTPLRSHARAAVSQNGTGLIHRFEGVEAKHLSESCGRDCGVVFDGQHCRIPDWLLMTLHQRHTILTRQSSQGPRASSVEAVTLARTVLSGGVIENGLLVRQTDSMPVVPAAEVVVVRSARPVPEFKDDDEFLTLKEEKGILHSRMNRATSRRSSSTRFLSLLGMRSGRPHGVGMALFSMGRNILGIVTGTCPVWDGTPAVGAQGKLVERNYAWCYGRS